MRRATIPAKRSTTRRSSIEIEDPEYDPGEGRRPKIMRVFFVKRPGEDEIRQVVLPVYGKGLWSTLYGYLALRNDLDTIQGLTFYEHGETPGLGGEVDNPDWKRQWVGKETLQRGGRAGRPRLQGAGAPGSPYSVDGLSGATITSRGVTSLVRYWASDDGYGMFLDKLEQEFGDADSAEPQSRPGSGDSQTESEPAGE